MLALPGRSVRWAARADEPLIPLQPLEPRLLMSVAPTAVDDFAQTDPDTAIEIDVLANDSDDVPIIPFGVTVVTGASNGTTFLDFATGIITYIPDAGFTGTDTFGYRVSDMDGNISNEAVVTVQVGAAEPPPPPVVLEDVTFTAPSGFKNRYLSLVRDGDMLTITNRLTKEVLFSKAMDSMNSLTIQPGSSNDSIHLMVDLSGGEIVLPGGLHLDGGDSRLRDVLVVKAMGPGDHVDLGGATTMVNGLMIGLNKVEKVKSRTQDGVSRLYVANPPKKYMPMKSCRPLFSFNHMHHRHGR